ncbi:chromatin modification-related protein eaf-1-like isoform X2 [Canna indica]|uniref:Chromatin modification-related protein eaf-1-like isoform X2 n=1 Tax=Canna indica TaxID=4628 RepID=A0AAQ3QPC1_9LILI|nr:chromatin modification-related protein eaf-1-like isoform X2 [Canna indica]
MGFDNECIVNIQSLPGEYFCPVCRTLIYPDEALQSQCTHLYCKPCLAYIVATTHACPYDGYLVTEADSKPLNESSKALAETIGKVAVHCLYHRSGCQWQGTLSECITHCTSCTFGNSPVVCNRCGTQIIHRQVQEHTQICPGLQPQAQQADGGQVQAATTSNQAVSQDPTLSSSAAPASGTSTATVTTSSANTATAAASATPTAPAAVSAATSTTTTPAAASQSQGQANATAYAQAPTSQQWYQQQQLQYQQYYQMYPGYDPYQQQYQQYAQYQQPYPQYSQPQMQAQHAIQGQQQPSSYGQPQPQFQAQSLAQTQPQMQAQPIQQPQPQAQAIQLQQQQPLVQTQPQQLPPPQPQPQLQPQPSAQLVQVQSQQANQSAQQSFPQAHQQTNQPPQVQIAGQQFGQPPQPHYPQIQQQQIQAPSYQQTLQSQQHPPSLPQQQLHPHAQPQPRPAALQPPPMQPQLHSQYPGVHPQTQAQPVAQPQHPSAHSVTGHQSFQQPQILQQTQPGAPPQRPMLIHLQQQVAPQQHPIQVPNQFAPQQPPRMPPPSGPMPVQAQQQPMLLPQRPPASHPQQQPHLPVHQHGQQLHQYPGMHSQSPQGLPPGHVHPSQQFPQGMVPSQQQMHPQGPPHMQHVPAQPHQQNVPPGQGLPTHQGQTVAMRPIMANNAMPHQPIQQFSGGPCKPVQPGFNQQSPSQSHLGRSGTNLVATNELQKSHLPQSGSHGVSGSLSSSSHSDKVGHAPELSADITAKSAEGSAHIDKSATAETKNKESDSNTDNENVPGESKEKNMQPEVDSSAEVETMELTESKPAVKEELAELPEDGIEKSHVLKDGYAGGSQSVEAKPDEKVGELTEIGGATADGLSEGKTGDIASKTQASQQLPALGGDGNHLQQPTHQHGSSFEGASFQPGYHDRNVPQSAWQGLGTGAPQVVPSAGPLPGKEVYPPQQFPYGHPPNMPGANPRFQAPDRALPHHMPRPLEAPPYQMQAPGQNMASGQMRPLGQSFPEHLPHQGQPPMVQEPLRPPTGQPYGVPGTSLPSGRGPGNVGFPQQGLPEQGIAPQGHGQNHFSQPHTGARVPHGEALMRPPQFVPHSGALSTTNQMMPRGPPFHPEDRGGPSHLGPVNPLDSEMHDTRRPGFSDIRQPDPLGQLNVIKANGIPGKMHMDGMHDPAYVHGFPEDRFKPLPDERFRPLPEDGIGRPFPLDAGRHNVGRREFEEDLKQFPRPAHLDAEGMRSFDSYGSSLRPLERGRQQVGPDALTRPFDRALPRPDGIPNAFSANQAGHFPISRPGSEHHMPDILEARRPAGIHDEFRRHMDVLPPVRSPNRDFGRFASGGKPRLEDIDPRELHGFAERSKAFNLPSELSGSSFLDNKIPLSSMLGSGPGRSLRGEPFNRGRIPTGDPAFGGSYGRDFPNEAAPFSMLNVRGEMEAFELLKKRKPGTMGWCRICSIDCETVEGLDLHAQTREHQKMAMDMVLSIKREINKKQSLEDAIRFRHSVDRTMGFQCNDLHFSFSDLYCSHNALVGM